MEFKNKNLQIAYNEAVYKKTSEMVDKEFNFITSLMSMLAVIVLLFAIFAIAPNPRSDKPLDLDTLIKIIARIVSLGICATVILSFIHASVFGYSLRNILKPILRSKAITKRANAEVSKVFINDQKVIIKQAIRHYGEISLDDLQEQYTELEQIVS